MRSTEFLILATLVASATADNGQSLSSTLSSLSKRQTSATCVQDCNTTLGAVSACGETASCLCAKALADRVITCVRCAYAASPTPEMQTQSQKYLNDYAAVCKAYGFDIGNPQLVSGAPVVAPTTAAPPPATTAGPVVSTNGPLFPTSINLFGTAATSQANPTTTGAPATTGPVTGGGLIPASGSTLTIHFTTLILSSAILIALTQL